MGGSEFLGGGKRCIRVGLDRVLLVECAIVDRGSLVESLGGKVCPTMSSPPLTSIITNARSTQLKIENSTNATYSGDMMVCIGSFSMASLICILIVLDWI